MVELCIGILSACLPTYRPLFSRTVKKFGSNSDVGGQYKHRSPGENSDLSLSLQQSHSNPSHSKKWAHLGVLGDLQTHGHAEVVEDKV